jgi:hypothetical protein
MLMGAKLMKRILIPVLVVLLSLSFAYSLKIEDCFTYDEDIWECSNVDFCTCVLDDTCTDGDLMVYQGDIDNVICIPEFYNETHVEFDPSSCDYTEGELIQVRAFCDEGYTDEEDVQIYDDEGATTIYVPGGCDYTCQDVCIDDDNPPICFEAISHGTADCGGGEICCELIEKQCPDSGTTKPATTTQGLPCPYECCMGLSEYETKNCPAGEFCCSDNTCKADCTKKSSPILNIFIFVLILGGIGFLVFYIIKLKAKNSALEEF